MSARNPGPGAQRGRAPVAATRGVMFEPVEDLGERPQVALAGARYSRPEVVHDHRLQEGMVEPAPVAIHASRVLSVCRGMRL